MTGPDDPPDVFDLSAGLSREEAIALRESFDPEEQVRISHTVAELLDLLGKTHTMAVLSAFAFAEGLLQFSDLETELDVAPNTLSTRLKDLTEAVVQVVRVLGSLSPVEILCSRHVEPRTGTVWHRPYRIHKAVRRSERTASILSSQTPDRVG